MRWRVISAKSRLTRLGHELDGGVKWSLKRLCLALDVRRCLRCPIASNLRELVTAFAFLPNEGGGVTAVILTLALFLVAGICTAFAPTIFFE